MNNDAALRRMVDDDRDDGEHGEHGEHGPGNPAGRAHPVTRVPGASGCSDGTTPGTGAATAGSGGTADATTAHSGGAAAPPTARSAATADAATARSGGTDAPQPASRRARQTLAAVQGVFAVQPTGREDLPDPAPIARDLARCVIEVLAGARELDQIARWITDEVHRNLQVRVSMATRARSVRRTAPQRPVFSIGSVHVSEPRNGVAETTVIVHARARTRAVAIRLEGRDGRWRATAVSVL